MPAAVEVIEDPQTTLIEELCEILGVDGVVLPSPLLLHLPQGDTYTEGG